VISLSPSKPAHLVGFAAQHRHVPWIADVDTAQFDDEPVDGPESREWSRLERRLILAADTITCATEGARQAAFERLGASPALVKSEDDSVCAIDRQVQTLLRRRHRSDRLRILMIGPVNSPHMEHLALSMAQRGHLVQAGGSVWGGGLPPSSLPDAGIPVSVMTWPQPLWIRCLLRSFRPHVVHANWMPFAAAAAVGGARPLVAMAWGSDVYLASILEELTNRLALRRADLALADSAALLDRLVELGARPERIALLNWGVDLRSFKPPATEAEKRDLRVSLGFGDGPVVISPRGFKSLYNPKIVIEAFAQIARNVPDAQLILKHHGEDEREVARLAQGEGIRIVGHVPYERMADYYRAADVCLSIPDTDSSPRSVWEAMACGCACVLSDLPWVRELIEPDVHALVVPIDASRVAAATTLLLTDPVLRGRIAENARQLVEMHRDAAKEMDRLEELYLRLSSKSADRDSLATAASKMRASSPASWRRE
jgi:glycosyltransferase involved in cell wall biosynthesis